MAQARATYSAVVGHMLRGIRKQAAIPQLTVAAVCGVNQSAWSKIERGDPAVSLAHVVLACRVCSVAPDAFVAAVGVAVAHATAMGVRVVYTPVVEPTEQITLIGTAALDALTAPHLPRSVEDAASRSPALLPTPTE